jgi:MFS family permease
VLIVVLIGVMFVVWPMISGWLAQNNWWWYLAPIAAALPATSILLIRKLAHHAGPDFVTRQIVNSTELYLHLRRSFADAPAAALADGELAVSSASADQATTAQSN